MAAQLGRGLSPYKAAICRRGHFRCTSSWGAWQPKCEHCQAPRPALQVTPAQGTIYKAAESFKDLGLHPNLLRGLYDEMNFETPSKIQAQVLPLVLERSYKSLIAQVRSSRHDKSWQTLMRQHGRYLLTLDD